MKKKQEESVTSREALKINLRAFRILYRMSPGIMVSGILDNIWRALSPYVGIYLSALLLDELAGNRDPGRLRALVLWILLSAAVISLINDAIQEARGKRGYV